MSQLRQKQNRFSELNIEIKLVVFDNDFMAVAYAQSTDLNWPMLLDQKRTLYREYGMERGSWWRILNPISVLKYILQICRGSLPGRPGEDWRQLGGDVLIDPSGIVRVHHISRTPHDHPSTEDIFQIVEGRSE
ncbi:AhpC/TSA family protein [Mariniblastus fucicola]|uniref:AhpC/TSA family protein n=1 Tax=Mariniblastus fucicola TaxID=980251 RepID=UPI0009466988|nr:AhpC/TSA family protein [Mariniblastus fucicola]